MQNKQQSNLSAVQQVLFVHGDFLSHYSVELLFINVAIGAFCTPSPWGRGGGVGYGLGPGWVLRSGNVCCWSAY